MTVPLPPTTPPAPTPRFPTIGQAERLYERVVYHLTQAIVEGRFPPASALPSEPELAAQFAVSRTVIREAIRVLAAKGLVAVKHGSGMRVRPVAEWDRLDATILFARIRAGRDEGLLRELFALRRIIEVAVVELAAEHRSDDDLAALDATIADTAAVLESLDDADVRSGAVGAVLNALDIGFHRRLALAAGNGLLEQLSTFVTDTIRIRHQYPMGRQMVLDNTRRVLRDHRRIAHALAARDPAAAAAAIRAHINTTEEDVRALLLTGPPAPPSEGAAGDD